MERMISVKVTLPQGTVQRLQAEADHELTSLAAVIRRIVLRASLDEIDERPLVVGGPAQLRPEGGEPWRATVTTFD